MVQQTHGTDGGVQSWKLFLVKPGRKKGIYNILAKCIYIHTTVDCNSHLTKN